MAEEVPDLLGVPETEADDVRLAVLDPLEDAVSRCVGVIVALAVALPEGVSVEVGVCVPVSEAVLVGDAVVVTEFVCSCDRDNVTLGDPL